MDYKSLARRNGLEEESIRKVESLLLKRGNFTRERVQKEIEWFFGQLGISDYYFQTTPVRVMAGHIESLRAAEIIAANARTEEVNVDIRSEKKDETFYLVDDTFEKTTEIELRIEERYKEYRLESYRTKGRSLGNSFLRLYFISRPRFNRKNPRATDFGNNINLDFTETCSKEAAKRYEKVYNDTSQLLYPCVKISRKKRTNEIRIMVSLPPHTSEDFLSKFSEVMTSYGLNTTRKYVEPMRNGRRIFSFYLELIQNEELLENLKEDISLISLVGETPIDDLFISGKFTAREYLYAFCLSQFTHQFITSHTAKIEAVKEALRGKPELHGIVRFLKLRLNKDTYTLDRIYEVIRMYPDLLKNLYHDFWQRYLPGNEKPRSEKPMDEARQILDLHIPREIHKNIGNAFLAFNKMILKTNFYKKEKIAIAFRLSPDILDEIDYPDRPFGIFFIVGKEKLAFHVRFRDIARGGIRIIRSRNVKEFTTNSEFVFDENYSLSHTQQRKNKDIPEGGAKGTILLKLKGQNLAEVAFKKYIDALLDLLLEDTEIVDRYGKEEILFLGPDEGTAGFMDWASSYARQRGYPFWKSFTTGKNPKLGGIPHDLYGMTTTGVHEYELQVLECLKIREPESTKFQTGGPDGDLGSNEILVSQNRYIALVDASGVLYDSDGLDRAELLRLARARKTVSEFRREKLSPRGFLVLVDESGLCLFDGTYVRNGTDFRNNFHLSPFARADLFVPCGGRPQSINILNWKKLLDENGKPVFKVIVEGANLFITQEARLELEKMGCIIIKDASANKGGVTSSSLEVLASLTLDNDEYERLFCVKGKREPAFRRDYIEEVLDRIRENARREFRVLWREREKKAIPLSILSDRLSEKINELTDLISESDLIEQTDLRNIVISRHVPRVLLKKIGMEKIMERLPAPYMKAMFASNLASDFVYNCGLDTTGVDFYCYLETLKTGKNVFRCK